MTGLIRKMIARNHWEKLVTNEIITDPGHRYVYTAISKTACTQVRYILADTLKYPEKLDRTLSPITSAIPG